MNLGQRIKQARLELGLSQRTLCGDTITRNMLSQIENGSARPSMDTLRVLAERLGRPMSYFLEEVTVSANQSLMERTRDAYIAGEYGSALEILEAYQAPDEVFDQEAALLRCLCRMELAEQALSQGRLVYARQLLEAAGEEQTMYWNAGAGTGMAGAADCFAR